MIIVDEFTGRLMPGRRWSDGLHQAIEAKEGVKIERENQTLATITFQNYFRMYKKLAGMTGTADTEAAEFGKIYNLDVIVIPTNRPMMPHGLPTISSTGPKRKSVRNAAKEIAENARRPASRCWSAPSRSRSPRGCRGILKTHGRPPRSAQRQESRARSRTSWRRRAARARSPSPPTWPAAVPTFCSAATPSSSRRKRC